MDKKEIEYKNIKSNKTIKLILEGKDIWLTVKMIAELYNVDINNIIKHINNVFSNKELDKNKVSKNRMTYLQGIGRKETYYNLEIIISIGYKINSNDAIEFRKWITSNLKNLRNKNEKVLEADYFKELIKRIRNIISSEKMFHQKIADLYSCLIDYEPSPKSARALNIMHNKFIWATTRKNATELIIERANALMPNMGLVAWKDYPKGKIKKSDIFVTKNYLTENELSILNRILSMIFDYAILQAQRQISMKTSDLKKKINDILNIKEEDIFKGKMSIQIAHDHANKEYLKYIEKGALIEVDKTGTSSIYLRNLSIENLRTFGKKQTINFTDKNNKPYLWNVIIGDNGIGKTSILKALSLPLIRPWGNIDWIWRIDFRTFERFKSKMPQIDIEFEYNKSNSTQTDTLHLDVFTTNRDLHYSFKNKQLDNEEQRKIEETYSKSFLLFVYGASRHISTKGISVENNFSAQTIFDDNAPLMNTEEWIIQSEYKAKKDEKNKKYKTYHQKVISIIKTLLKDEIFDIKIDIINETPKVLFETQYGWVNLHELSLGYKTLLSWVIDFVKGMLEKYSESKNPLSEPAICIIDEIDLHIHPALQNKVIKFLSETFTKTQFIVTAHSPLIVQALENANIILLKYNGKSVEVQQNIIDIRNWRIDQILMSDLFGMRDVYSLETQQKLQKREKFLRKDTLTKTEQIELKELNNFENSLPVGNTQNEIEGFALLRQFAQKIAKNQNK